MYKYHFIVNNQLILCINTGLLLLPGNILNVLQTIHSALFEYSVSGALPLYEKKTYMPCEVKAKVCEVIAKVCHRLLSQVYFLHTFALIGRKYAKNILDLKVDGTLSL